MKTTRRAVVSISAFLTGLFWTAALSAETLRIGALLSLTGNWSSLGQASQIMMEMAQDDLNQYLAQHKSNKRIKLNIRDTQLKTEIAVDEYLRLARNGAVSIVGPQSSAEVAALRSQVARKRVPILSQGSTASSLAQSGDHVYRMVPDDTHEADALLKLLQQRGVTRLIPMWRDDSGNNGLHDSLKSRFEAAGGSMSPGIRYSTNDQQDFSPVVAEANRQLAEALDAPGASPAIAAIYVAGFDEVVSLMKAAMQFPQLKTVRWYGSDGVALSQALLNDPLAAQYAADVDYPNPTLGLPYAAEAKWKPCRIAISPKQANVRMLSPWQPMMPSG